MEKREGSVPFFCRKDREMTRYPLGLAGAGLSVVLAACTTMPPPGFSLVPVGALASPGASSSAAPTTPTPATPPAGGGFVPPTASPSATASAQPSAPPQMASSPAPASAKPNPIIQVGFDLASAASGQQMPAHATLTTSQWDTATGSFVLSGFVLQDGKWAEVSKTVWGRVPQYIFFLLPSATASGVVPGFFKVTGPSQESDVASASYRVGPEPTPAPTPAPTPTPTPAPTPTPTPAPTATPAPTPTPTPGGGGSL